MDEMIYVLIKEVNIKNNLAYLKKEKEMVKNNNLLIEGKQNNIIINNFIINLLVKDKKSKMFKKV